MSKNFWKTLAEVLRFIAALVAGLAGGSMAV